MGRLGRDDQLAKKKSWDYIKSRVANNTPLDYADLRDGGYRPFVQVGDTKFFINLYPAGHRYVKGMSATNDADYTDFINNYKPTVDSNPPVAPGTPIKNAFNRLEIHSSARPTGTYYYFTSEGDSTAVFTSVGGGEQLKVNHKVGDSLTGNLYVDFNSKGNRTFIQQGAMQWVGCTFDTMSMEIVPRVTAVSAGTNTYYNVYGGYLIVPAAGDGVTAVAPEGIQLVEATPNMEDGARPQAFWNADHDAQTGVFSNIAAAPLGDGLYNMFSVEVPLVRFVHKILLVGDGRQVLTSDDSSELGHNMRIKLSWQTDAIDHDWQASVILTMQRERSA